MDKLKIGIVGAGGIANGIHLPVLARREDATLTAVCDLSGRKAADTAARFGVSQPFLSYHEMLERKDIDAVYVLTEPDALFRVTLNALRAGKHVFMEKPMGINLIQAKTLRDTALAFNRCLHVGFNRRFIPLVTETVSRLRKMTEITHVEGRFYKNSSSAFYGGCSDAFTCDVIHVIDLVRHIAGGKAVLAVTMETAEAGAPGAWYSMMRFGNGVTGLVRSNYRTGGRVHTFEIHGEGASAYIDLGFGGESCKATILYGGSGQSMASGTAEGKGEILLDGKELAASEHYEDYYGYRNETDCFINAVRLDEADKARLDEDFAAMELVDFLQSRKL